MSLLIKLGWECKRAAIKCDKWQWKANDRVEKSEPFFSRAIDGSFLPCVCSVSLYSPKCQNLTISTGIIWATGWSGKAFLTFQFQVFQWPWLSFPERTHDRVLMVQWFVRVVEKCVIFNGPAGQDLIEGGPREFSSCCRTDKDRMWKWWMSSTRRLTSLSL